MIALPIGSPCASTATVPAQWAVTPMPAIDAPDPGAAGFVGSLVVAEFADQASAERWLAEDPYVKQGVFARTTVRPFKKVLP